MAFDLFKLAGSVFIDTQDAENSLHRTDDKAQNFGATMGKVTSFVTSAGIAIAGFAVDAAEGLWDVAGEAANTADNIDKMSQKVGISAEAYQEWQYIMDRNGMSVEKLQTSVKTLADAMYDASNGSTTAQAKFDALGLSYQNLDGSLKSSEQMLNEVITTLANMPESAERTAMAVDLLGRSGTELGPLLNSGSASIEELRQKAHDLGLVMSDEAVKSGAEFTDAMTDLESSFGMLATNLGTALLPLLTDAVNLIVDNMPMVQGLIAKFSPIIIGLLENLMPIFENLMANIMPIFEDLMAQITPMLQQFAENLLPIIVKLIQKLAPFIAELIIKLLPVALDLIIQFMPVLDALIPLLDPIIACTLELIDILTPVLTNLLPPLLQILTEFLTEAFVPLVNFIMGDLTHAINHIIGALLDEAVPSIKSAFDFVIHIIELFKDLSVGNFDEVRNDILAIVDDLVSGFVNNIVAMANTVINVINSLVQDIASAISQIGGMFTFGGSAPQINIPKIPKIPRLAEGGIIDTPGSVLVGEVAPEVLSLPRGAQVTPLDKVGSVSKDDIRDAMTEALQTVGIQLELSANSDALFDKIVKKNTEFRRRHDGASALA